MTTDFSAPTATSPPEAPIPFFVHRYNEKDEGRVTHSATQEFIQDIRKELGSGYHFVPFIGAGFSVSSGIPITEQLHNYLKRCICVALGAENDAKAGPRQLWNPRTDQWPPFIDRKRPEPTRWQDLVRAKFESEDSKPNGHPKIFQEAFGAMAEWRTSLLFLSRLVLESPRTRNGDEPRLSLGIPQQEVIDACFREVMRHKKPSLNHLMLGSLSGPLRLDLILSTNFDDLLEQAFEFKRISLHVFEVQLGGGLPDYSAVSRVRALIKLHGSLHSVRADYSLDAPPSSEDKNTFVEYLTGEKIRSTSPDVAVNSTAHLLVLGVGATERRSLEFIRCAWKRLHNFKVFWVCYSERQEQTVLDFCRAHLSKDDASRTFHILRHTEIGLLLLHIYQDIRKTLPPSGAIFPSVTRIPLPPLARNSPPSDTADNRPVHEVLFCTKFVNLFGIMDFLDFRKTAQTIYFEYLTPWKIERPRRLHHI